MYEEKVLCASATPISDSGISAVIHFGHIDLILAQTWHVITRIHVHVADISWVPLGVIQREEVARATCFCKSGRSILFAVRMHMAQAITHLGFLGRLLATRLAELASVDATRVVSHDIVCSRLYHSSELRRK